MAGISIGSLILVVILAVLIFGSKKIRSLGTDVGEAVKGFKKGIKDVDEGKHTVETVVKDTVSTKSNKKDLESTTKSV